MKDDLDILQRFLNILGGYRDMVLQTCPYNPQASFPKALRNLRDLSNQMEF